METKTKPAMAIAMANTPNMTADKFKIRRYTLKELASWYGCSRKTMWRWIQPINIGPRPFRFYSSNQVRIIIQHIGKP